MKTCKKLPGGWSKVHALVAVAAVSLVAAVSVGSFFKDGGSALKAAVAVPAGYSSALWFNITFPSGATIPLMTVNHASTGDTLTVSYTSTDKNSDGKVDSADCAGANGPIVYWGTYRNSDGASKPVTFTADATGKCVLSSYALTDSAGVPLKLALTSREISPVSYYGTPGFIKYATSASPVTEWNGITPTVEVIVNSSYGSCDSGKYWDTATSTCVAQPSCGSGVWDSVNNTCLYNTCYTDTWATSKPECGPNDTDYSKCRDPYYWYNKSTGAFEKCTPDTTVSADFCNNNSKHTNCQSVKDSRVALLKLAFETDPAIKTEWLNNSWPSLRWEPTWDSTQPYKKYDTATDALVACSNNTNTTWTSGTYYATCQPVATKWESWYLTKWRNDYADWKKTNAATTTFCNNDAVCQPAETAATCPADCGSTATVCDFDNVCEPGESTGSCPSDCGATVTVCDYDNVCEPGETPATCPGDCNASTPPPAPTVLPPWPPIQTGCASWDTQCINSGSTGPVDGWCFSGMSCYDSAKTEKYCQSWTYNTGSSTTCPATHPKLCGPNDTSCIEPGAYGPESGWCTGSMECYVDGKKFCQPMSNDPNKMTTCPAGAKLCPPSDPNCVEPGATSKNLNGWCHGSSECYNNAGTEKYCLPWDVNPNGVEYCPSTHPKQCRPDDTNCIEIGGTGPSSGWCASGGKQCYVGDQIACVGWDQDCPAGAKACRSTDPGCVEPGSKVKLSDGNSYFYWCGGGSAQCYSKTEMECVPIKSSDMYAWESITCSAGFGRCRADDTYCLELGETGPSGSWCGSGTSRWNADGTVTCVSSRDGQDDDDDDDVCLMVQTPGYNPDTGTCKVFADSCMDEGYIGIPAGKVCKDGKVVDLADSQLDGLYDEYRKYLEDVQLQVMYLPDNPSVKAVNALVDEAFDKIFAIKKLFQDTSKAGKKAVKAALEEFRTRYKDKIDALVGGDVQPYIELNILRKELASAIQAWETELSRIETGTEYFEALSDGVKKVKQLIKQAENQQEVNALRQILTAIKVAKEEVYTLVGNERGDMRVDFIEDAVEEFTDILSDMQAFVEENADDLADDFRIGFALERFEKNVLDIQSAYSEGDEPTVLKLIEVLSSARGQLVDWLAPYGFRWDAKIDLSRFFDHIDDLLSDKINSLVDRFTNKFQALLDEKVQEIMVKVAEVIDKFSEEFERKITVAVDNLSYIANETVKNEISEAKNEIIERVSAIEEAIASGGISTFTAEGLRDLMERVATVTWCGDYAEDVQAYINTAGLAIEAGEFDTDDLRELEAALPTDYDNNVECYETGASVFRDTPMYEWYYGPFQYNFNNNYIRGYSDASGEPTGECGPANPTLRIEALAMDMRILGIPEGDRSRLDHDVPGVPVWGYGYVNSAFDAGVDFDWSLRMDEPITRIEAIELITNILASKNYISIPTTVDNADDYRDYRNFAGDVDGTFAIEAMTDLGIIKGSTDGNVYPFNTLLRSEFAAMNQRVADTVGVSVAE